MRPLVSVVTPSFNQAQFLEETIRSVALQTYRPIQHIVMDGGSTDGSVEVLRRCAEEFGGAGYTLDWVSERDGGFADGLGKGFAKAQGEIVGWLNSDDVYFDRLVIETSVAELDKHPDVDVVHGDVALISESSGLWMIWCFPRFNYKRVLRGYIIPQPTVFFRLPVLQRHPIASLGKVVGLDHEYWLEIGREHKFRHIHRVQAGDRDHATRRTNTMSSQWAEEMERYLRTYGNGYAPTPMDRMHDLLVRLLMRFKGAGYLLRMFARGYEDRLAFPLWMDSRWKVLRRQFLMRITSRPELGPRPMPAVKNARRSIETDTEHILR